MKITVSAIRIGATNSILEITMRFFKLKKHLEVEISNQQQCQNKSEKLQYRNEKSKKRYFDHDLVILTLSEHSLQTKIWPIISISEVVWEPLNENTKLEEGLFVAENITLKD